MSSIDSQPRANPLPAATSLMGSGDTDYTHRMIEVPTKRWEQFWVWLSEKANPIVVKELRQSLKSKQFTISFGLTLIAAVSWTLIAISLTVPRIYYTPGGPTLLAGYFCILIVPLMVIIPFGAFRSLTSETEDSTFELLSISALSAHQIVYGKMASALLQMALYLSALAPCIVLTYALRGVSLFTILFLLGLTVVFSICETALALLLAAVGRTKLVQGIVAVMVLAGLLIGSFSWIALLLDEGLAEFSNPPREIYMVLFAVGTVLSLAVSLVLRTAAAAIDFPSENHSTPLRIRVFGLLSLIVFWTLFGVFASASPEGGNVLLVGSFIFMMIIGALMIGEYGVISPRAQRTLPKTFLGRIFLTWLYPGAGLGYIFVVSIYAGIVTTFAIVELLDGQRNSFGSLSITVTGYFLLCYLIVYLGVGRLIFLTLPKHLPARMLGSFTFMIVLLLLGHLLPAVVVWLLNDYRDISYGWHQASNIVWSINYALDNLPSATAAASFNNDSGLSLLILTLCAIGVFGLNLLLSTRDVLLVRVSAPPRVREDDQARTPIETDSVDPFAPEN